MTGGAGSRTGAAALPVPAPDVAVDVAVAVPATDVAGEVPREASEEDRWSRALLAAVADPGDPAVSALVAEMGAGTALAVLRAGELPGPAAARYRRRLELTDPGAVAEATARAGARVVVPRDPDWPPALNDLDGVRSSQGWGGRPVALWARGCLDPAAVGVRSVAIVGSREATAYGATVAADLAADLAESGWAVVSGGAYGIDGAAHRGALAAAGPTVAVLAGGIDMAYPRGNSALLDRISEEGLLLSESPPGTAPTRRAFLIRNRLIAALAPGTVVVEAALRSGALNTASWANACLRVVMAVPGPVTSPLSAGTHRLLRDAEAVLVTQAADVLAALGPLGPDPARGESGGPGGSVPSGVTDPRSGLDETDLLVLDALAPLRPTGLAHVLAVTGLTPGGALAALGRLGTAGVIESVEGGWRLSASTRAWNRRSQTPV